MEEEVKEIPEEEIKKVSEDESNKKKKKYVSLDITISLILVECFIIFIICLAVFA